jgi:ssRNA-specific RNase YbeY (16S rRNA maturation enzyme)
MINFVSSSRYKINKKSLKISVIEVINKLGISPDLTINIIFIGKNKMRELALTYKKEDVALPVLAFPYQGEVIEEESVLGEVFICYPQVILLAAERNRKVDETIIGLIKHGIENLIK